jgi:hypothetical protein
MSDEDSDLDIPEADFSQGVQPHRYAQLQTGYRFAVYLDEDLWKHFGSAEAVTAALKALIEASKHVHAA